MPRRGLMVLAMSLVVAVSLRAQEAPPEAPKGVEVLTRGPVHEAFASLAGEPQATKPVAKKPPQTLEEMPPAEKPEGDVQWIKGYWAWDDDRSDYLWVSGVWRTPPPGKQWVPGYWREEDDKSQWVPGFWAAAEKDGVKQEVTYLPQPPAPPEVAPPAQPPSADAFYVPGHWVWSGERYAWQAGYWGRVQPGYVWVSGHYRWTPGGYVYIPGYWDLAVSRRGVLYAPVVIDPAVIRVGYVYTPTYAVRDTIVIDTLWVRPTHCHYYFGDYYGPVYRERGYESCVVYSRRHYDSIIVYERWERRREPDWLDIQIRLHDDRHRRPEARPPRTLVQQNNIVVNQKVTNNYYQVVAPPAQVAAAKGQKVVQVDPNNRVQAMQQAALAQQAVAKRTQAEVKPAPPRPVTVPTPPAVPVANKPAPRGDAKPAAVAPFHGTNTPQATAPRPPTPATPVVNTPPPPVSKPAMPVTQPASPPPVTTRLQPPKPPVNPPAASIGKPTVPVAPAVQPPKPPVSGPPAAVARSPVPTPAPTKPIVPVRSPVKPPTPPKRPPANDKDNKDKPRP